MANNDPLNDRVCAECGHVRLNAVQASACCTMQGDDCPDCKIYTVCAGATHIVTDLQLPERGYVDYTEACRLAAKLRTEGWRCVYFVNHVSGFRE